MDIPSRPVSSSAHGLRSEASCRRRRTRRQLGCIALTGVVAVSCSSGGPGGGATATSAGGSDVSSVSEVTSVQGGHSTGPARLLTPDGPIRGVLLGDAVADGAIDGQRLAFDTDDTEATAFVTIGADAPVGLTLTVSWYRGFGEDRERLFGHEIEAVPGGVAYSQGLAPRGLAPGLYEIEASLDDHRVRTPWVVRRVDPPEPSAGQAASSSTLEDWEVPTPGESGSTDWDSAAPVPDPTPLPTCEVVSIIAGMSPMTDVTARVFGLGPCTEFTLSASVAGTPQVIASEGGLEGPLSSLYGAVDVCSLPGGSDLPGTVVHFELTGSATATEDYTLPDLSDVLVAGLDTTPAANTRVRPGDRIAIQALALLMPPAQGVKVLYVDDGSALIESVGNASGSDRPIPCDLGRYVASLESSYTIPDNPPPVVQLCAWAEGFDGTSASDCATFFTQDGKTWTGTVTARNSGSTCEGDEHGTLTIVVTGADVVGSFEASGSYACAGAPVISTEGTVTLRGTYNDEAFALAVDGWEGTLLASVACLVEGGPFTLTVTGDTATADDTFTAPSGDVYTCEFALQAQR